MKLTKDQRRGLEVLRRIHRNGCSSWRVVRLHIPQWLMFWAVTGVVAVVYWILEYPAFAALFAGILVGVTARDLGRIRAMTHRWPVLEHVIDWEKVAVLLDADSASTPQDPSRGNQR